MTSTEELAPIHVLVVEDDDALRTAIAHQLEVVGMAVTAVGTCAHAQAALGAPVAIALVDLGLPDGSGVEVIAAARAAGVPSLVLSAFGDDASVFGALRAGASGYCLKADGHSRIAEAVAIVLGGGAAIAPSMARRVLDHFRQAAAPPPPEPRAFDLTTLTARERELMELFAAGCTYAEVARLLAISINTVRHHVRGLYEKLHVSTKAEAVALVLRMG